MVYLRVAFGWLLGFVFHICIVANIFLPIFFSFAMCFLVCFYPILHSSTLAFIFLIVICFFALLFQRKSCPYIFFICLVFLSTSLFFLWFFSSSHLIFSFFIIHISWILLRCLIFHSYFFTSFLFFFKFSFSFICASFFTFP